MNRQASHTTAGPRTGATKASSVFSAYSAKVYACCVNADVALGWIAPYGARREELLALALCDAWRSHPDAREITVMRDS